MYQGTYDLACMAEDLIEKIRNQDLFAPLGKIGQLNPLQTLFLIHQFQSQELEEEYIKSLLTYVAAPKNIAETANSTLEAIRSENWVAAIALVKTLKPFDVLPLIHRLKTDGLTKNELEYLAIRGAETMNEMESSGKGYISDTQLDE